MESQKKVLGDIEDILALSPQQLGMLSNYLNDQDSKMNLEKVKIELKGIIDLHLMKEALDILIEKHEMLRTTYRWEKVHQPIQIILKTHKSTIVLNGEQNESEQQFNLEHVPFRVFLNQKSSDSYVMVIENHHILFDGWSTSIIIRDLFVIYSKLINKERINHECKLKYKDYIKFLEKLDKEEHNLYWGNYLNGYLADKGREKSLSSDNITQLNFEINTDLYNNIKKFIRGNNITISNFLYGVWGILIATVYNRKDVMFCTTVSTRPEVLEGIQEAVGLYINTLPIRITLLNDINIKELFEGIKHDLNSRLDYRYLSVRYDGDERGLLKSIFVVENYPMDKNIGKGNSQFSIDSITFSNWTNYNVSILAFPHEETLHFSMFTNNDVIDMENNGKIPELFICLMEEIIKDDFLSVSKLASLNKVDLNSEKIERKENEIAVSTLLPERENSYFLNENEKKLATIWSNVLNVDINIIHRNSDFFLINGHSLDAAFVLSKITEIFNVKISFGEFFRLRTINRIAEYIDKKEIESLFEIKQVPTKEKYLVSPAQKRIYIAQQIYPKSTAYNEYIAFKIEGKLDIQRLDSVFKSIVSRHDAFRTYFEESGGEIYQKVLNKVNFEMKVLRCENDLEANRIIDKLITKFDLNTAPLLRVWLIQQSPVKHILFIDSHHIVSDGVSTSVLINEINKLYRGEILPQINYRYIDYSEWQNGEKFTKLIRNQEEYWIEELGEENPNTILPVDFINQDMDRDIFDADFITITLTSEETDWVKNTAKKFRTTNFVVLLSVVFLLVNKITGHSDVIIGVPIANRRQVVFDRIVGMMVNLLPIKAKVSSKKQFYDLLEYVNHKTIKALEHQEYPFEHLVDKLAIKRDSTKHPLLDVVFVLQNIRMTSLDLPDLLVERHEISKRSAKFDLLIIGNENESEIELEFQYKTNLFKKETIGYIASYYQKLIRTLVQEE